MLHLDIEQTKRQILAALEQETEESLLAWIDERRHKVVECKKADAVDEEIVIPSVSARIDPVLFSDAVAIRFTINGSTADEAVPYNVTPYPLAA
jgi:hypothetical protein